MLSSGRIFRRDFSCAITVDWNFVSVYAANHSAAILGANEKLIACGDFPSVGCDSVDAAESFGGEAWQRRHRSLRCGSGVDEFFRNEFTKGELNFHLPREIAGLL
jgi:hypothetical protein